MLKDFLTALAGRRQFVLYRLEPKAGGGTNKIPVTAWGENSDAQDPTTWLLPEEAAALSEATGYGVGIVIYEGCGLACIDLDHCVENGQFTPFAQNIMARFPAAAKEISASLTGAHIFAACRVLPDHRTRRVGVPMEVYTRARFIALTQNGFVGSPLIDYTDVIAALIGEFFPEPVGKSLEHWTTEPFEGWKDAGLTDEQVIAGLRFGKKSAAQAFGGKVTFDQLWTADADALGKYFAPEKAGQAYNASAADQSLANQIAHRVGFNCERVQRIMLDYDCQLKRDKWSREDYMHDTITKACDKREAAELAAAARVRVESPQAVAPVPPDDNPTPAPITPTDGMGATPSPVDRRNDPEYDPSFAATRKAGDILTITEQLRMFEGMFYIDDVAEISSADGTQRDQKRFNNLFGTFNFVINNEGATVDTAWDGYLFNKLYKFPQVAAATFDPRLPARTVIKRDGRRLLNVYMPIDVPAIEGDVSLFLTHLWKMYPYGNDAAQLLAYFAAMVQYKGIKFQWAPLLQGCEGNGKTFLSRMMQYCLSARYTHNARASHIESNFNKAFENKLLIIIEDVKISEGREAAWEALKPMITNETMEIEGKGVDKVTRDVCFNFIMNSNHQDAIRKTANDRRIANFFGAQQRKPDLARDGMTPAYFKRLYDWVDFGGGYAAIHYYLLHYAIPDALNPATECKVAPATTSTDSALTASTGSVEQEFAEAIASERRGFAGGWISSEAFGAVLAEIHMERKITRYRRHEILLDHGYVWHPGLPEGRMKHALSDGSRPQLYVTAGHPMANLTDAREIAAAFTAAQQPK